MVYTRKGDLKVECIVSDEDFAFWGVTLDDVLERTQAGMHFLKKLKELCAMTQKVEWTNVAYTLNILVLPDNGVSFEFSECISDYVRSLKQSLVLADEATKPPLEELIAALENLDEAYARKLIAHFENNVKKMKSST